MSVKKNIHVVPHENKWATKRDGASRASGLFDTQEAAIISGRAAAQQDGVELLIHGQDGKIRERDSHGNDPARSKG